MLADPAQRLLPATAQAVQRLQTQQQQSVVDLDVLAARSQADLLEAAAAAERRQLKLKAADRALHLIYKKLELMEEGQGQLEDLLRVVAVLDPEAKASASVSVQQVEVVFRTEGRADSP